MEDNTAMVELLLEQATDYGKTSYQLAKLKLLDKTADSVSTIVPRILVIFFMATCGLFGSLGLAIWLGGLLGTLSSGLFVVAGAYGLIGLCVHVFLHRWLKKKLSNYIILKFLN